MMGEVLPLANGNDDPKLGYAKPFSDAIPFCGEQQRFLGHGPREGWATTVVAPLAVALAHCWHDAEKSRGASEPVEHG
jgi:hypothetical protein